MPTSQESGVSYDIDLFIPEEGFTLKQSHESQCVPETPTLEILSREDIAAHDKVIERLKQEEPNLELFRDTTSTTIWDRYRIQIVFFSKGAAASVPYWYSGEESDLVFSRLWDYLIIMGQEYSYHAYDPQFDEYFSLKDRSFLEQAVLCNEHTLNILEEKPWQNSV